MTEINAPAATMRILSIASSTAGLAGAFGTGRRDLTVTQLGIFWRKTRTKSGHS
jgi:hypothetical protein